jgi:hypothetical protein
MTNIPEENQQFSTIDAIFVVALLVVVTVVSSTILSQVFADHKRVQARMKAEALAFRLASRPDATNAIENVPSGRHPASAPESNSGEIGLDPWGHAYHYNVTREDTGKVLEVEVWSAGPNGQTSLAKNDEQVRDDIRFTYRVDKQ